MGNEIDARQWLCWMCDGCIYWRECWNFWTKSVNKQSKSIDNPKKESPYKKLISNFLKSTSVYYWTILFPIYKIKSGISGAWSNDSGQTTILFIVERSIRVAVSLPIYFTQKIIFKFIKTGHNWIQYVGPSAMNIRLHATSDMFGSATLLARTAYCAHTNPETKLWA